MTALTTYVGPRPELHTPALRPSLVLALYQAAKVNLDLGTQMHFIVRGAKVCAEISYQGAMVLMLRSPGASHVDCFEIRQNDTVEVANGRLIRHEVHTLDPAARGPIIACCARLHYTAGHTIERIIDLDIINAAQKAGGAAWKGGPGNFLEMVRKTAILRLRKLVPLDSRTQSALDEIEANSMAVQQVTATPVRRIQLPEVVVAEPDDFTTEEAT
jgi:recombinational DNA repair protein RecT